MLEKQPKGRKVVVTRTEEEIPENQDQELLTPENEISPEEKRARELDEYLTALAGPTCRVKIKKTVEGLQAYCGMVDKAQCTEDYIMRRWGSGEFFLYGFDKGHQIRDSVYRLVLYKPEESRENGAGNAEVSILREQINQQNLLIMKMIESTKNAQAPTNINELIQGVAALKALTPAPPSFAEMIPGLTALMNFVKQSVGSDTGESWPSVLGKAIDKLPGLVGGVAAMIKHTADGKGSEISSDEQVQMAMIAEAIGYLKKRALKGKDPVAESDWIISNFDEPQFRQIAVVILNQPFESLGQLDADILKEPLRTWFLTVYNALHGAMVQNENPDATTGAGGGSTDVGDNAPDDN